MGQTRERSHLQHAPVDFEGFGHGAQHQLAGVLGFDQPIHRQGKGHGELVTA